MNHIKIRDIINEDPRLRLNEGLIDDAKLKLAIMFLTKISKYKYTSIETDKMLKDLGSKLRKGLEKLTEVDPSLKQNKNYKTCMQEIDRIRTFDDFYSLAKKYKGAFTLDPKTPKDNKPVQESKVIIENSIKPLNVDQSIFSKGLNAVEDYWKKNKDNLKTTLFIIWMSFAFGGLVYSILDYLLKSGIIESKGRK